MNTTSQTPVQNPFSRGWQRFWKYCKAHRRKAIASALVLLVVLALALTDALIAAPLRTWAERVANSKLNGYTVRIGRARPHIWRLALELDNVVLAQNAHPEPPVADFHALKFSLVWRELVRFRMAGDLTIERPALHINLAQISEEARSRVSLKDRGWQNAVESIYPIKLDQVNVQDGSLLYLSEDTTRKPIQLTQVFMVAKNVRNIAAAKDTYPSPVILDGVLFDTGKFKFKGEADFLRKPNAAARGELQLDQVPLDRLDPIARNYQLKTTGGNLSVKGSIEYTPETQTAHFKDVLFENLQVDYVTSSATKNIEKEHSKQAIKLAKRLRNAPRLLLKVDSLRLTNSQIGFENKAPKIPYRLFLSKVNLNLENLSNQAAEGRSNYRVQGAFMGSGSAVDSGGFKSTARPVDLDLHLKLENAKLTSLNGFLRSFAGVDVAEGQFSIFSEISVKGGRVEGYLKPLIKNLKIYDREKDKGKRFGKRVEMHVLQFLANVFKNHTTKDVATVIRISGATGNPEAGEWEAIRKLIGNGLMQGILPGFLDKHKSPEAPQPKPPEPPPKKN